MTDINKQKFLAELGKLLTFMYEEDRQEALALYSDIFDSAEDQQALMNCLVSPTRQAVVIARAYNAKERKLQIHAQSRDSSDVFPDSGETPAFIQAIMNSVPAELLRPVQDEVSPDQISFFDDSEDSAIVPEGEELIISKVPEESAEAEPAAAVLSREEELPAEEEPAAEELLPIIEEEAPAEEPALNEEAAGESSVDEAEEPAVAQAEEEAAPEEAPAAEAEPLTEEIPAENEAEPEYGYYDGEDSSQTLYGGSAEDYPLPPATVLKPRVFLLILYVIFALPITVAGIVILLIPTILFLALACAVIYVGALLLVGAFRGFPIFADIMVVLGSAVAVLALGLLFFWLFIWFIGGAMAGLIHGVMELGKKWCYKEVPAV